MHAGVHDNAEDVAIIVDVAHKVASVLRTECAILVLNGVIGHGSEILQAARGLLAPRRCKIVQEVCSIQGCSPVTAVMPDDTVQHRPCPPNLELGHPSNEAGPS